MKKIIDLFYHKILIRITAVALGLFGFQQGLQYFHYEPFKDNLPFFITLGIAVFLADELLLIQIKKKDYETLTAEELEKSSIESLREELLSLEKNGLNEKILRARDSFCRNFLIEQKIDKRLLLGEFAERAAIRVEDKEKQAAILTDDLGYSFFLQKKFPEALNRVKHGLEVANSIGNHYWIAKAHRHQAAILVEQQKDVEADQQIDLSIAAASQIENVRDRDEMLGGILYGRSQKALKDNKPQDALVFLEQSELHRKVVGDRSRLVKTLSLKGRIYEKLENYTLAKDCYIKGLFEAEKIERLDEMIRNHRGLARIYEKENNSATAAIHRKKAEELSKNIFIPFE